MPCLLQFVDIISGSHSAGNTAISQSGNDKGTFCAAVDHLCLSVRARNFASVSVIYFIHAGHSFLEGEIQVFSSILMTLQHFHAMGQVLLSFVKDRSVQQTTNLIWFDVKAAA